MSIYQIKLNYTTGDSFKTVQEESILEYEWKNLEVAKENLKRIKEHYLWYMRYDKNWQKTMPSFCKRRPNAISYSIYDISLELKSDNEDLPYLVYPFWTGYFEHLHWAEIVLKEEEDNDLKVYMH